MRSYSGIFGSKESKIKTQRGEGNTHWHTLKLDFLDVLGKDVVGTSTVSLKTCFASSPLSHWGAQLRPLAGGDLAMDSDHVDEGGRLF